MNPILILGAVLVTVILWFLLTFLFQPLGKFLLRIIDDTIEAMEDDEKHKEKEKIEKWSGDVPQVQGSNTPIVSIGE